MAEKKTYKVTKIGAWGEPVKVESNGKTFTNVRCTGKAQNGDRESEVILQVGSTGMASKMKVGESYVGRAVMKDDDSGLWVIAFAASDNESLAAPKKDFGPGGGYSGGGSRNPDDGIMACACGFVKSKIEAGAVADNEEIMSDFRYFFNNLKATMAAKNSDPDTKSAKEAQAEPDESDIPF